MLTATDNGADREYGDNDAADELLKLWNTEDANEPSEDDEDEEEDEGNSSDDKESDEDAQDEPSEDDEDESDEKDEAEDEGDKKDKKVLKDTDFVKVKVGDSEEDVPVSKLTRLYGQEKALTQKSMEVAETRKAMESAGERHVVAAEGLMKRAQSRYEPYAKVDWALAVKELTSEEFTALRTEATGAYEDYKFYEQELDGYVGEIKKFRDTERAATASKTIKALSDPKTGIAGFNKDTYINIRDYAVSTGMDAADFGNIVDEVPLRLMHKAMLYDKGAKAITKKVDVKGKRIVKSRSNGDTVRETFSKNSKPDAMKRLRNSGESEDAEAVLMARWAKSDD